MGESKAHSSVLAGCRRFLRPIARFLLRTGVGYREFNEVVKSVFVEVASEEYGLRGRPTNISRVAVMTGLTRKEVRRIREEGISQAGSSGLKRSPANQVLNYWHTDSDFQNDAGLPVDLPFDGGEICFMNLARRYGGDVPPIALLKELKRGRAVVELKNGKLRAIARFFEPVEVDSQFVSVISFSMQALASTIDHNSKHAGSPNKYLQRFVSNSRVRLDAIDDFRAIAEDGAEKLLDRLDRWLAQQEVGPNFPAEESSPRVGMGIYYFQLEEPTDLD